MALRRPRKPDYRDTETATGHTHERADTAYSNTPSGRRTSCGPPSTARSLQRGLELKDEGTPRVQMVSSWSSTLTLRVGLPTGCASSASAAGGGGGGFSKVCPHASSLALTSCCSSASRSMSSPASSMKLCCERYSAKCAGHSGDSTSRSASSCSARSIALMSATGSSLRSESRTGRLPPSSVRCASLQRASGPPGATKLSQPWHKARYSVSSFEAGARSTSAAAMPIA
mmetsp:Transcript_34783/g.84549  ORF Transcript_34783/g.84549 Transcript_34783/m.84549 type:complete len:229 (+) Transcript_34783:171-857(+)